MSYPTQPAYIHVGNWNAETRSHPAMKFMENFTRNAIDNRTWTTGTPASEWHIPDYTLYKANGEVFHGAEKAWSDGISSLYAPFAANSHEPNFLVCWETEEGWDMLGQANVYANLHTPGSEPKVKDGSGKEWDVVTPSAFHFEYVKDSRAKHDGVRLKSTRIFADSGPALMMMLKRGQVKPADLGL